VANTDRHKAALQSSPVELPRTSVCEALLGKDHGVGTTCWVRRDALHNWRTIKNETKNRQWIKVQIKGIEKIESEKQLTDQYDEMADRKPWKERIGDFKSQTRTDTPFTRNDMIKLLETHFENGAESIKVEADWDSCEGTKESKINVFRTHDNKFLVLYHTDEADLDFVPFNNWDSIDNLSYHSLGTWWMGDADKVIQRRQNVTTAVIDCGTFPDPGMELTPLMEDPDGSGYNIEDLTSSDTIEPPMPSRLASAQLPVSESWDECLMEPLPEPEPLVKDMSNCPAHWRERRRLLPIHQFAQKVKNELLNDH